MTRYSDDEISKIRETIVNNMRRQNLGNLAEVPEPEIFEDIGMAIPTTDISLEQITQLTKSKTQLSSNVGFERMKQVWWPFIGQSIDNATLGTSLNPIKRVGEDSMMISPITGKNIQIIGGTSGTLKSTYRKLASDWHNGIIEWDPALGIIMPRFMPKSNAVHIDPDEARLVIPEYRAMLKYGLPGGSSFVHPEARALALEFFDRATGVGGGAPVENIIYDTSGQFNSGHDKNIRQAIKNGYRIDAIYFFADMDVIWPRLKEREVKTGRGVPAGIPETIQDNLRFIIPQLFKPQSQGGLFNSLTLVDTSIPDSPQVFYVGEFDPSGTLNTMIDYDNDFVDTSLWAKYAK